MAAPRCYTLAEAREKLKLGRSTFFALRAAGELPMLDECLPRLGRFPRYRADLIDRYLDNQLAAPRSFSSARSVGTVGVWKRA